MFLRPIHASAADALTVRQIKTRAFTALAAERGEPPPPPMTPAQIRRNDARLRHLVHTDPHGCWLAERDDGEPVGVALALRRESLWGLSLLAVVPEAQGKGAGRMLLDQVRAYGRGCLRGIIVSSADPRAARRYHGAGFRLHPMMRLTGAVDAASLPDPGPTPVHLGDIEHQHLLDSVDRRTRGGAHGPDHVRLLAAADELLLVDTLSGSGYCYRTGGRIDLLAATSRRLAARLLIEALSRTPPGEEALVEHLTAEQDWAVDVGLAAGLTVGNRGYLALRGMRPPAPYLPSGAYL
ncbi:GNAT family N-acetyltransferase [Phaeacidiphilus oryzae]|uniref:GNAT family N-acetyltransferase n=1 Tax=Phaeacidiphilus oryzae TaxID=348818 RepID=UPI00055B52D3|nr:GNAT family N-acetyltransferase [Phaeacidiphilus oryzae]